MFQQYRLAARGRLQDADLVQVAVEHQQVSLVSRPARRPQTALTNLFRRTAVSENINGAGALFIKGECYPLSRSADHVISLGKRRVGDFPLNAGLQVALPDAQGPQLAGGKYDLPAVARK